MVWGFRIAAFRLLTIAICGTFVIRTFFLNQLILDANKQPSEFPGDLPTARRTARSELTANSTVPGKLHNGTDLSLQRGKILEPPAASNRLSDHLGQMAEGEPAGAGSHSNELASSSPLQHEDTKSAAGLLSQTITKYPTPLTLTAQSPYAYAFLVGGCGPESPGYKGFLWGIMVSTAILRAHNSTADVIALIQMAGSATHLPPEEESILAAMRIRVQYLPPVSLDHSFYDAVLEKLRVLQLVEYRRVLFMDADIMPLDTSLDYIFHASDNASNSILKPNILRATRGEPCNAGFFVLEPGEGKWERLQEIIDRREVMDLKHKWRRHWDLATGWGVSLGPEGGWKSTHKQGSNWKFWFAAADQGLLYYWGKYIEQNVTLMIGETFENWVANNETSRPMLEKSYPAPFDDQLGPSMRPEWRESNCINNHNKTGKASAFCHAPVRDLHHFYGSKKPWTLWPPETFREKQNDATSVFFYYLDQVNEQYGLGLNITDWATEKEKIKNLPLGSSNSGGFWGDLHNRLLRRRPYLLQKAKEWNITIEDDETVVGVDGGNITASA